MNVLFHTAPLGPEQWAAAALVASLVLPLVALQKQLRQQHPPGPMCPQRETARSPERA
jgi:hypothetical protein